MRKHCLTVVLTALLANFLFAQQVPQAIPYQAVLRDAAGGIMANQSIEIRFSIHQNDVAGPTVFEEKHTVSTGEHGLVNLVIGLGTTETGTISAIDWPMGPFFLQVWLNDGAGWKDLGTTQLLSVPFALMAGRVLGDTIKPPVVSTEKISDSDKNTSINTETYPNEDIIRYSVGGLERWQMHGNALENSNSGKSIFIGANAGSAQIMDTDRENTFIGHNAGQYVTTGFGNTYVGANSAALNLSTGEDNTFVGAHTGVVNQTGYVNVFVGEAAGYQNKTGAANTFVGQLAGFLNDNGAYNTYIGRGAGKASKYGQHNTYLGRGAGFNMVDGRYNVFIGDLAGFKDTTGDRQLIIETDTSFAAPLIWGNFSSRRVGLNRKAATNTLEVGGEASKNSPGEWLGNSDRRLKTNIQPLNSAEMLQKMLALRGVSFEWNDRETGIDRPKGRQTGFVAQEIEAVFPEKVQPDAQGFLQTAYGTYDPMMVESMRAIVERLEKLEAENAALKKQVAEILKK